MSKILNRFSISGRGVVVVLDEVVDLPIGQQLTATIRYTDGSTKSFPAYREVLKGKGLKEAGSAGFLLEGTEKTDVPIGCTIHLHPNRP